MAKRIGLNVIFGLITLVPLAVAQTYNVTDLGTFPGGTVSQGDALNDCGQVVGYARFSNFNAHGFSWKENTGLQDLGAIPPTSNFSVAQSVNKAGIVAGYSTFPNDPLQFSHAVLWVNGEIQDIGTLANGRNDAQAMGINDRGEVAGFSVPHAFFWTVKGGMRDLGTLPGGSYSQGLGINAKGEVVGFSDASGPGIWHAFVWSRSQGMRALPYLVPGDDNASANAINGSGEIVGGTSAGFRHERATLWHRNGTVEDLGVLPEQGWSVAFAINDSGQAVGWSGFRAFIWSRQQGMQDLNALISGTAGWLLILPTAINNRGEITGQGLINGQSHGFVLTPVSEAPGGCK